MVKDYWAEHLRIVKKDSESERFNKFFSKESTSLCKYIKRFKFHGKKVLDLGCGYGRDSYYYAKNKNKVTGVDVSRIAISSCRKSFKREHLNGKFLVADAKKLPFEEGSFDIVHIAYLLHFFKKKDVLRILKEAKRVLVTGGLVFANAPSTKDFRNKFEAGKALHRYKGYFYRSSVEVRQLFRETGFKKVKTSIYTSRHIFYAKKYPKNANVRGWIVIAKKP